MNISIEVVSSYLENRCVILVYVTEIWRGRIFFSENAVFVKYSVFNKPYFRIQEGLNTDENYFVIRITQIILA